MKIQYFLVNMQIIVCLALASIADANVSTKDFRQQQSYSTTQVVNKKNLESKLKGLEFTKEDIERYKKIQGYDNYLVKDCETCLFIINANLRQKGTDLNQNMRFLQERLYPKLTLKVHKIILEKMIFRNGAYYSFFISKQKKNYKSISEAVEEFEYINEKL